MESISFCVLEDVASGIFLCCVMRNVRMTLFCCMYMCRCVRVKLGYAICSCCIPAILPGWWWNFMLLSSIISALKRAGPRMRSIFGHYHCRKFLHEHLFPFHMSMSVCMCVRVYRSPSQCVGIGPNVNGQYFDISWMLLMHEVFLAILLISTTTFLLLSVVLLLLLLLMLSSFRTKDSITETATVTPVTILLSAIKVIGFHSNIYGRIAVAVGKSGCYSNEGSEAFRGYLEGS